MQQPELCEARATPTLQLLAGKGPANPPQKVMPTFFLGDSKKRDPRPPGESTTEGHAAGATLKRVVVQGKETPIDY